MKFKSSDTTKDSLSNDESFVCASDSNVAMKKSLTPQHIAIIMDGNNRWAKNRLLPGIRGHKAGVEAIRSVLAVCEKHEVKVLTLFAFSSENWQRPADEVGALMNLFLSYLKREVSALHKKGVRMRFIGRRDRLQADILNQMVAAETLTQSNEGSTLVLAVDYGGQWDMTNAATEIAKRVAAGEIQPDQIDESLVNEHLCLHDLPKPDLCVRTGGEFRISNFILWQMSYAELYFTECFWPDFDEKETEKAIAAFAARQRRFGMTSEQVVDSQNSNALDSSSDHPDTPSLEKS